MTDPCTEDGHEWSEWVDHDDPEVQWRICTNCYKALETRPAVAPASRDTA